MSIKQPLIAPEQYLVHYPVELASDFFSSNIFYKIYPFLEEEKIKKTLNLAIS